jgi:predicted nucleic acid-binding protein
MKILIDTNILLRRAQPVSPHHQLALDVLIELVRAGHELCLVPQVIYEFWCVATRPANVNGLGTSVSQAKQSVDELLPDFVLLKDERGIYSNWQLLVVTHAVSGKTVHDARLVAAMQRHGLTHLLTFNVSDFQRFPGVTALSPVDMSADKLA